MKKLPSHINSALDYVETWLEHQYEIDQHLHGLAVAISYKGKVALNKTFGYANLESQEKLTRDHIFRVASHSKTFTAVCVFQLVEKGKCNLDDHVCDYLHFLKENPDKRFQKITIRQLLNHSAGIMRDGEDASFWSMHRDFPSQKELISFFKTAKLVFDQNTCFKYSNYGYGLLGMLIENLSGLSYKAYIERFILKPLALNSTQPDYDPNISEKFVSGYTLPFSKGRPQLRISPFLVTNGLSSATGFCSNAESLCVFYSDLIAKRSKLISEESAKELRRVQWKVKHDLNKSEYAHGLVTDKFGGNPLKGHSGGFPGQMTYTLFDDQDQIVVSVLTNTHSPKVAAIQNGIWHILDFFKKNWKKSSPYEQYSGRFYNLWLTLDFVPFGKKIYAAKPSNVEPFKDSFELTHHKENKFKITKASGFAHHGEYTEFFFDNSDKLKKVIYAGYPFLLKMILKVTLRV